MLINGLRDDSRFKLRLNGMKVSVDTMMSAITCDYLAKLWWSKTEDAEHGTNKPISILSTLLEDEPQKKNSDGYDSVEEFNRARKNILKGGM